MPDISDYVHRINSEMSSSELSQLFGQAVDDPVIDQTARRTIRDILMPFYNAAQDREMQESQHDRYMRSFRSGDYAQNITANLDVWELPDHSIKPISKMSIKALKEASKQLEEGWTCYGQRHKSVTINRVLKEKTHAA